MYVISLNIVCFFMYEAVSYPLFYRVHELFVHFFQSFSYMSPSLRTSCTKFALWSRQCCRGFDVVMLFSCYWALNQRVSEKNHTIEFLEFAVTVTT